MTSTSTPTPRPVSRPVVATGIAGTVFIAALAFWLSFTALRQLAIRAGIDEHQAWAWPLIVDGVIVVATVGVVAMRRQPGARYAWALLGSGAAVSVSANAIEAALPPDVFLAPALAAAVSSVPPIVLLAITHLTVVLTRTEPTQHATPVASDAGETVSERTGPAALQEQPGQSLPTTAPKTAHSPSDMASGEAQAPTTPVPASKASRARTAQTKPSAAPAKRASPGTTRRSPKPPRPEHPVVGDTGRTSQMQAALALSAEGVSNREIARRLGVGATSVARWLKEQEETNANRIPER